MTTIIDLASGDNGTTSLNTINDNFDALNAGKLETSAYTDATTSVAGKTKLSVAPASASSPIAVGDNDPRVPTAAQVGYIPTVDEKAALDGTGTPAAGNKFVTADTLATEVSDLDADIAALAAGLVSINRDFTAGADIQANDSVYLSASNTVKQMNASAFTQAAATTTTAGTCRKQFRYSNSIIVESLGAEYAANTNLVIYSKTLDTAETTLANPANATIFNGGGTEGAYFHDVCEIGTGKYMFIWQKETASTSAAGIFATCVSYNGSTFSVGTSVAIEATGVISNDKRMSVSKLDTDKALIMYRKDSDATLYGQVLTVSGTTITTNTPTQISSLTNCQVISAQITTDKVLVKYTSGVGNYARVVTATGTSIASGIGAENILTNQYSNVIGGIAKITTTKFLWCTTTAGTNINTYFLTISGNTVTNGSSLMTSAIAGYDYEIPITIIGSTMALISGAQTNATVSLLDITGATPTLIQSTAVTGGASNSMSAICKIKPWTYIWSQNISNTVIKLTPQTLRIGTAPSAIASAATGSVSMRYQTATLTGLTVGTMYIDDDAQPTIDTSLTAPTLGTALTTTTILLS